MTKARPGECVIIFGAGGLGHVDAISNKTSQRAIRPYDPHHFLHHMVHKDQPEERRQRAPEEPAFYEKMAEALASAGTITVIGHGAGKSNAAHHLTDYLRTHHRETYQRISRDIVADLTSITAPQLLDLAQRRCAEGKRT